MAYPGQPTGQPADQWQPGQDGQPYQWDDAPDSDPEDDPNSVAPQAAIPTSVENTPGYQPVQGYENVGFGEGFVVPPPPLTLPAETERPTEEYSSASNISEDDARAAMIQFVSEHCCYGSKPAKEMEISSILPSSALHYQLETFSESRETSRDFVHYKGRKPLMGPMHGMAPPPWNIMCSPTNLFQDEVKELEVPYTAFAARCHNCDGRGFNRCYRCHGRGRVRCGSCHASGHTWRTDAEGQRHQETCHSCHGSGRKWCYTCGGDGRITCASCKGYRMLKHYVKLTVRLDNVYVLFLYLRSHTNGRIPILDSGFMEMNIKFTLLTIPNSVAGAVLYCKYEYV
uniref:Protein SSUH2 homolog n=1 Tax=Saccoglossus kowalevskii TaxID=10224 RepID=A0ABM0MMR7_SACKO|nr:PREDICTED: protein SSUH2 homolog [Saccoglossus kowalevskii]